MKIVFTGAILQPSWPGGEPAISRKLGKEPEIKFLLPMFLFEVANSKKAIKNV